MRRLLCSTLLVVLLTSSLGRPDEERVGSVVIFAASQKRIVIGADSKEIVLSSNSRYERYDKCKIATLNGKFVFAATGKSGHHSAEHSTETWDIFTLVREVASRNREASIESIAQTWGNEVAKLDNRDSTKGGSGQPEFEGQHALFAGFVDGHPVVDQVIVTKESDGVFRARLEPSQLRSGNLVPSGHAADIALEMSAGQTERARQWLADFRRDHTSELSTWDSAMAPLVERVIELSIKYSVEKDDIGPPIDLAEIDSSGVHWLRKKDNCAE